MKYYPEVHRNKLDATINLRRDIPPLYLILLATPADLVTREEATHRRMKIVNTRGLGSFGHLAATGVFMKLVDIWW